MHSSSRSRKLWHTCQPIPMQSAPTVWSGNVCSIPLLQGSVCLHPRNDTQNQALLATPFRDSGRTTACIMIPKLCQCHCLKPQLFTTYLGTQLRLRSIPGRNVSPQHNGLTGLPTFHCTKTIHLLARTCHSSTQCLKKITMPIPPDARSTFRFDFGLPLNSSTPTLSSSALSCLAAPTNLSLTCLPGQRCLPLWNTWQA